MGIGGGVFELTMRSRNRPAKLAVVLKSATYDRRAISGSSGSELRVRSFGHCHTAFLALVRLQFSNVSLGDRSRKPHKIAAAWAGWEAFAIH